MTCVQRRRRTIYIQRFYNGITFVLFTTFPKCCIIQPTQLNLLLHLRCDVFGILADVVKTRQSSLPKIELYEWFTLAEPAPGWNIGDTWNWAKISQQQKTEVFPFPWEFGWVFVASPFGIGSSSGFSFSHGAVLPQLIAQLDYLWHWYLDFYDDIFLPS